MIDNSTYSPSLVGKGTRTKDLLNGFGTKPSGVLSSMVVKKAQSPSVFALLWCVLLFMMICFPQMMQEPKIVLLILLVVSAFDRGMLGMKISKDVLLFLFFYMTYAFGTIVMGIINQNEIVYIFDFLRINVVYIVLMAFLAIHCFSETDMKWIIYAIMASAWFVAIYSLLMLLVSMGIWPESLFIPIDGAVGIHEGYTHLTNSNTSSYIFIIPFLGCLAGSGSFKGPMQKLLIATFVASALIGFVSGRRILWIIVAVAVVGALITYMNNRQKPITLVGVIVFFAIIVAGMSLLTLTGLFNITNITDRFVSAFAETGTVEDDISGFGERSEQISQLLTAFMDNPVFGAGAGGVLENGYVRSLERATSFEVTYLYVLFTSGIVWTLFYVLAFVQLIVSHVKIAKRGAPQYRTLAIASLFGLALSMFADATNPYFSSSFDYTWMVLLPMLVVHFCSSRVPLDKKTS